MSPSILESDPSKTKISGKIAMKAEKRVAVRVARDLTENRPRIKTRMKIATVK